jgi:hypothetical protein
MVPADVITAAASNFNALSSGRPKLAAVLAFAVSAGACRSPPYLGLESIAGPAADFPALTGRSRHSALLSAADRIPKVLRLAKRCTFGALALQSSPPKAMNRPKRARLASPFLSTGTRRFFRDVARYRRPATGR